ncbi:MAG: DUF1572 family protein [Dehalococcoidia bacterium]|jgi:uncharacterized damage-inducible protein DinB|nr:DUF1572 family protein [Dehalococcoidia bacterium]
MNHSQADAIAAELIAVSRAELQDQLRRLEACVGRLTLEQLWERRHDTENSVGNLLLHLRGNVRQWLVCGVGGQPDDRDRDAEFSRREPMPAAGLLEPLRLTLAEADAVLARLSTSDLLASRRIQDHDVTILHAIYHVVEHFSGHVGQVIWATKRATGEDLGFYRYLDPNDAEA